MKEILDFLAELACNNNREWFNAHNDWYKRCHEKVEAFTAQWLEQLVEIDPDLADLQPKDCIWRIYRDVRFSHDKRPFKVWFGIFAAAKGGRKSDRGGYYVHLEPNRCMFGGGIWCPNKDLLHALRKEVMANYEEVEEIFANPMTNKYFQDFDTEYMLKQQRCIFMTNVIKNSIQKGDLKTPDEFWTDYSMEKDSKCIDGKHDGCDKVYIPTDTVPNLSEEEIIKFKEGEKGLYTLGYIDVLEEKFGTGRTTRIEKQIYAERGWQHPDYWTSKVNPTCDLFEAYIMNAMWFTPEEFHQRYNTGKNTLIKKKYDFVVDYMKKQYGIDLVGIANGKKKQ